MKKIFWWFRRIVQDFRILGLRAFAYHRGLFIPIGIVIGIILVAYMVRGPLSKSLFGVPNKENVILNMILNIILYLTVFIISCIHFGIWKSIARFLVGNFFGLIIFLICLVVTIWYSIVSNSLGSSPMINFLFLFIISGFAGYFFTIFIPLEHISIYPATLLSAAFMGIILRVGLIFILIGMIAFLIGFSLEILFLERQEFQRMINLGFMSKRHKAGGEEFDFTN